MDAPVSELSFFGYKINKIDFKINSEFKQETTAFKIDPELKISIGKNNEIGVVIINCSVFTGNDEAYPFSLNIEIEGGFNIKNVPEEKVDIVLQQNAVAILYPYLRATISCITSITGINTLNLPIVNISAIPIESESEKTN